MKLTTSAITLVYNCPGCGMTSDQPLTELIQNGTHTCDCGRDMLLSDEMEVDYLALILALAMDSLRRSHLSE